MLRKLSPWMCLLCGILIGLVVSGRIRLEAQDRARALPHYEGQPRPEAESPSTRQDGGPANEGQPPPHAGSPRPSVPTARAETALKAGEPERPARASAQDVLLRPFHFPFKTPTTLAQVCLHLKQTLGVPVVLDIAALGRQDVEPEDTVQLELDGVRLKTGLKLLLDQVGLTYHVVPDDNLLIITDREGAENPLDRVWSELRALHRDLHDIQDAVDDLTDALYEDEEGAPRVRKPTIIEEKPERDAEAPGAPEAGKSEPKAPAQKPGARSSPSRGPLKKPGRSL